MKVIKQTYIINAPIKKVWDALTKPKEISGWGGGPAEMNDRKNSSFSLWGGDIWGKNLQVISGKKLVQKWFGGDWNKPSILTIELSEEKGVTTVKLTHKNVPAGEIKNITSGWKEYYFGPMKEYLEK